MVVSLPLGSRFMSVQGAIADIDKGKQGRAVAHVAKTDVAFRRKGAFGTFEGGPAGIAATELMRSMILNIAQGGKLDSKSSNGQREKARASDNTFRRAEIDRMIEDREAWGPDFKKQQKEAKQLGDYRDTHPDVFFT
jgi:hypothetical protein